MSQSATRKANRDSQQRFKRLRAKRKFSIVLVDPFILKDILIKGINYVIKSEGLPPDVVFYDYQYDPYKRVMIFLFGHESFKPVKEGDAIPQTEITLKEVRDEAKEAEIIDA